MRVRLRVRLSEPVNPRYVYVNPITNTVHVLPPVGTGTEPMLDNTCKTVLALQEFFGKRSDSAQLENSARHELIRYKNALKDDLDILDEGETKRLILDRLAQVNFYIDTLSRIEAHPTLNTLSGGHPIYPQAVKELLAATHSNLHSMLLRPTNQDGMLNAQNPKFKMDRISTSGTLFHILHNVFPTIIDVPPPTPPQEELANMAMEALHNNHLLPATVQQLLPVVVNVLNSTYQAKFNEDIDFSRDEDALRTLGYELTDQIEDQNDLEGFVAGVINSRNAEVSVFPLGSPFNAITMPIEVEKLSIMTQFLLAEINFYVYAKRISTINFAQALDTQPIVASALAALIKTGLENGLNIEQSVVKFINDNRAVFELNQNLSALDLSKIANRFARHYETIKESDHFDEFMVLDHDQHGGFFAHQGSICFDFSDLLRTSDFRSFDNGSVYARARREIDDLPIVVPGREIDAIGLVELDEAAVKVAVIAAINDDDYTSLRRYLLSTLEDGSKVFDAFGRDFFAQFDTNVQARNLFIQVRRTINDAAISNRYNRIVRGQDAQLLLTPEMARSLYVAAVSNTKIPQEMTLQYSSLVAIQALLNHFGIANASVTAGFNGNFVIDSTRANIEELQRKIEQFTSAIHLTPSIAKSLYKQVSDHYGDGSAEYLGMMALDNQGGVPRKVIKALALLDVIVAPESFSCPNNGTGTNGYIVQDITDDSLRIIQEVHEHQANRFKLTQDMALAIYQTVGRLSLHGRDLLNRLSNDIRPDKLEAALMLLGLDYGRVEFNEWGGYNVYLPEAEQAKLKLIANLSLTPDERALIPGYRPYVDMPDNKSARGYLFEDILTRSWADGARRDRSNSPQPTGIRVQKVRAFRSAPIPEQINPTEVELNCPEHILHAFQRMLRTSRLLGTSFLNPYTNRLEQFPRDANQLTARHLQILARNEQENYNGVVKTELYNRFLSDNEIAKIRCFVKASTVAGTTYATHFGGYPDGTPTLLPAPQKTIVIDQPSLQWLGDLRNTGGLFFYPRPVIQANVPSNYGAWQKSTYRALFGSARPEQPTGRTLNVVWNGVHGRLDLNGVAYCVEKEFSQALDAAASQSRYLAAGEQVNFIFLKAGTGHSLQGLGLGSDDVAHLEEARLQGILKALRRMRGLSAVEQRAVIGRIGRIELPFSGNLATTTLREIQSEVEGLGLQWGAAEDIDAFVPRPGFINATTSCSVSHAMVGNGGRFKGISAAMATNAYLDHLNAGFNTQISLRVSPGFITAPEYAAHVPMDKKRLGIFNKLEQLIGNIDEKRNGRAVWFTLNTDSKLKKLQAISDWIYRNELSERQEVAILALIRDVCAIKRNYFGFHSPHSLDEFNQLFSKKDIARISKVTFTASDLKDLGAHSDAIDDLLRDVDRLAPGKSFH